MSESIDFVVFLRKIRNPTAGSPRRTDRASRRMVAEILEINGFDGARVQASAIYVPGPDGRAARDPGVHVTRTAELAEVGWDPDRPMLAHLDDFPGLGPFAGSGDGAGGGPW
jgi:pilus assembly protein CpaF